MSLLLDALKKAADDKQKALQAESQDTGSSDTTSTKAGQENTENVAGVDDDKTRQTIEEHESQTTGTADTCGDGDAGELTLEDINEINIEDIGTQIPVLDASEQIHDKAVDAVEVEKKQDVELQLEKDNSAASAGFTVSDDALSMLIYKTNRDVNRSKKILIAGALVTSLAILMSGGVFYYMDMQAEISSLERKHRIAMQSMSAKTSREKTPEKTEIVRSLVGEPDPGEKVHSFKKPAGSNRDKFKAPALADKSGQKSSAVLSIQKNKKVDLVSEKLNEAWLSYESGRYEEAKNMYREVINIEKKNRDALLGLGAIAVIEENNLEAKEIYLSLLEQNPRDSMAVAALAELHDDSTLKADEEYLLTMLKKNPGAQHLSFALGNNYAQQKRWKSAQKYYFEAWQSDPENADYIFNLAVSMDQLDKQEQAINFYKDSLNKAINKQVSFSREAVQKRINELSEL